MGSYLFRWPYNANEVFVTGTFDDWGKTVQLEKKGDFFEKEVHLPSTDEKVSYKFVVDGIWTTDSSGKEENDGNNNINNVLLPEDLQSHSTPRPADNNPGIMAGVTPDSTTAALAAQVPKEGSTDGIISSAAPDSTSAELAKQAVQERGGNVPGSFPQTPQNDTEEFSVNPIPASSGHGNPVQLRPGEKVPDPSAVNENTVGSTVRTDKAAYDADASAQFPAQTNLSGQGDGAANDLTLPTETKNLIPESSLPMGDSNQANPDPGYTIHSVGPPSTTAALAAGVPLESNKQPSHQDSTTQAVDEVPGVVRKSIAEAHEDPEAAGVHRTVEEKKDVENELQQKVQVNESGGEPAPTATAATSGLAPHLTGKPDSTQVSPRSTSPVQPTVTTGVAQAQAPTESGPGAVGTSTNGGAGTAASTQKSAAGSTTTDGDSSKKDKRRSRTSDFFHKLKEKFK